MRPAASPLPPSKSLPRLQALGGLSEGQLSSALQGLSAIYCPLPVSLALVSNAHTKPKKTPRVAVTPVLDSGYVSGTEDDEEGLGEAIESLAILRADVFERTFVQRWLTGFIAHAEDLSALEQGDARQNILDQAYLILESLFTNPAGDDDESTDSEGYARNFSFDLRLPAEETKTVPVQVQLNDHLAGTDSFDHEDVGLQSWGASIVFSQLICDNPSEFGFTKAVLGPSPRIFELGAGTGLVSMVVRAMLPRLGITEATVVATDYHPAVLANLRSNIDMNPLPTDTPAVQTCPLDWAAPMHEAPLDAPADMLIATDAVYAPDHAIMLRDCASQHLAQDGVFWLMETVRQNGRFAGINETVETAFSCADRPRNGEGLSLTILHQEAVQKCKSIGRGDESGYRLFRIGWR